MQLILKPSSSTEFSNLTFFKESARYYFQPSFSFPFLSHLSDVWMVVKLSLFAYSKTWVCIINPVAVEFWHQFNKNHFLSCFIYVLKVWYFSICCFACPASFTWGWEHVFGDITLFGNFFVSHFSLKVM